MADNASDLTFDAKQNAVKFTSAFIHTFVPYTSWHVGLNACLP